MQAEVPVRLWIVEDKGKEVEATQVAFDIWSLAGGKST